MTRHYRVNFFVEVDLKVEDEVLDRALSDDFAYSDMTKEAAIEMLARCIGIYDWNLSDLDGWADMGNSLASARTEDIDLESIEEITP